MEIQSPAQASYWLISGQALFLVMHVLGLTCFAYIMYRRLVPLLRAQPDFRFDQPWIRLRRVAKYWLGQWRHPRYKGAGLLHILIFIGFIVLAGRAFSLLMLGASSGFVIPGFSGTLGRLYDIVRDYAATVVFVCMIVAAVRRIVFKPARYAVPARFGRQRGQDAIFLLALIAILMLADSLFEGSKAAARTQQGQASEFLAVFSLPWICEQALASFSLPLLSKLGLGAYFIHNLTFYFLL